MNNGFNQSVKDTPFRLNYGMDPLTPLSVEFTTKVPSARDYVQDMVTALSHAKQAMQAAQDRMAHYRDKQRRPQEFAISDKVLLKSTNLNFKGTAAKAGSGPRQTRKLLPKWVGPFKVLDRVGDLAYKLELPPTLPVHNVFHVELLKPWRAGSREQPPPAPVVVDGEEEWHVEAILGHKVIKEGRKDPTYDFLVRWKGYGPTDDTWEPQENVENTVAMEEYRTKVPHL
jgi:hypothetical protein